MPEVKTITFTHREIAEALIKVENLHEGLWGLYIEFGFKAANVNGTPDEEVLTPAAIALVQKIGIQRFDEANNLTVDASKVNRASKARPKPTSTKEVSEAK